jgi:hypothetical protein
LESTVFRGNGAAHRAAICAHDSVDVTGGRGGGWAGRGGEQQRCRTGKDSC